MSKGWLTVVPLLALAALGARPVHAPAGAAGAGPAAASAPAASAPAASAPAASAPTASAPAPAASAPAAPAASAPAASAPAASGPAALAASTPATPAAPAAPATPAAAGAHLHLMRPHGTRDDHPATAPRSFACAANDLTVCLVGDRFEVTATFTVPNGGGTGSAHMVKLTDDSAYMWFFSADNVEAVLKVLNGCALDSRYWFFAGGLTNVDVVITVTDSMTGTSKQYHNPQGTPFQPIQDTSALAVCP